MSVRQVMGDERRPERPIISISSTAITCQGDKGQMVSVELRANRCPRGHDQGGDKGIGVPVSELSQIFKRFVASRAR